VLEEPGRGVPWHREVEGTMVMADLSGFTALSERLGKLGDEGAERLTLIINAFFERMLETAARYGGDTITFGGDAILLLFDGSGHARRACTAALEMLRRVERAAAVETADGKVKIGMSVGAHSGMFVFVAAGLPDERAHLIVLGRGAELTARAEAQAERGELAVSASSRALLPDGSACTASGDYWRVEELPGRARPAPLAEPPAVSPGVLRRLDAFLPPYARADDGRPGETIRTAPEHRRTVIAFVNVLGLDDIIEQSGVEAAVEQLQAYAVLLTGLAVKHNGFVVSSDISTRGSKLIVTFGAPVAHEHAPTNAARFALELNAELRRSGLGLSHKIGVNGGHVFAGEVGPPFRRQYTVMGDAVNLAARLMAAAGPGEVLANRDLLNYVSHELCARELPPIRVKGKEEPVAVCALEEESRVGGQIRGEAGMAARHSRLFGRRDELELLWRAWQRCRRGEGGAVLIEGEPGVGKTRLLEEGLRPMSAGARRVVRAACLEHLQAAPFTPWIDVLHAVMELPRGGTTELRTETVRAYLERRVPDMAELGALLNPLLAVSLPRGDVVASLEGELRLQRLFALIARILEESAEAAGTIVVVEDLHWMDESSRQLVRHLAGRAGRSRMLLLLTTRPVDTPLDFGDASPTVVTLTELTRDDALALVSEALGLDGLPPEVGDAIYAKTRGNPLFLEEVVHSVQVSGALERILAASNVRRAAELAALEIPDRVQGLLMSRIDRLRPSTREVLKAGSVVGRSFDQGVLEGMDDELLRSIPLDQAVEELVTAALVLPPEDGGTPGVTFRHALVRDVAYESMPFSRRRVLHGRVARHLEAVQSPPDHGLLVHHYRIAGESEQTRLHAVRAAEASVAVYANHEAVDYLAVALETATGRTPSDACRRSRFEELMGDSLAALSRQEEAITCFVRSRRRWTSPAVRRAAPDALRDLAPIADAGEREGLLCWKIAVSTERGLAAYRRALRWLDRGAASLPPQGGRGVSARILITKGLVLSRLGRYRQAVEVGEEGRDLARREGDAALQAYASTLLGNAFYGLGLPERAHDCDARALELYGQAGDLAGQALSHCNLAASYSLRGDLRRAMEHSEASLALYARIGNVGGVAFQHQNIGGSLLQAGDLDGAREHLEEAIRLRGHQGVNEQVVGFSLILLSQARLWAGDLEASERAIIEARAILEKLDAQGSLLDAGIVEAELRLAQGRLEQAEATCREVVSQARSMSAEMLEAEGLSMLGRVRLAQGDPAEATACLETSIELAEKDGSDYERAKGLAVLAEAQSACVADGAICVGTLDEAIALFEKMGAKYDLGKALEARRRLAGAGANG
jgi:class 3 adenylate cyclase